MSGRGSDEDAFAGKLGALRWAVVQQTEDAAANLTLIQMGKAGNNSWRCYMAVAELARRVGCDPRTVQRKLRYLELRGYIEEDHGDHRRRTRLYRIFPDRPVSN